MALDKETIQVELRKLEKLQFEGKMCIQSLKEEIEDLESAYKGVEASKIKMRLLETIQSLEKNFDETLEKNQEALQELYETEVEEEEEADGDTI